MTPEDLDRTGLIRESYLIDGISAPECRSIFLDWAIKLPQDLAPGEAIGVMLATYGDANPDHPMTEILKQGLNGAGQAGRRGGRRGRLGPDA